LKSRIRSTASRSARSAWAHPRTSGARCSPLSARCLALATRPHQLCVRSSAFPALRSPLCAPRSALPALRSPLPALRSQLNAQLSPLGIARPSWRLRRRTDLAVCPASSLGWIVKIRRNALTWTFGSGGWPFARPQDLFWARSRLGCGAPPAGNGGFEAGDIGWRHARDHLL
jgi:hypothetical protein